MSKYPFRNLVFQGGGVKAFTYHGALRVLEREGLLDQIERTAGASAGAAMATFIAMRLGVDEIIKLYQSFNFEQIKNSHLSRMPDHDSNPGFLQRELERIQNNFSSVTRLATKFGWYSSEYAYLWMQETMAKYCHGHSQATFAQFREWGFRDLSIVVTNLTTHSAEIFSAATTPNAAVVDAVLMSQALPIFFEAVQYDGREMGRGDHYLDGGLLVNYPLQLFDERPFARNNRWFVNGVNWETLGCRTYTPKDCPPRSGAIKNLMTYAQNVFEVLIEAQAAEYRLNKPAQRRSIDISDCCVRTTDWDIRPQMDDERYLRLVSAGEKAATAYLENYIPPVIKPLLPFSWYLDRGWRSFTKWLDARG